MDLKMPKKLILQIWVTQPKLVWLATDLAHEEGELLIHTLKEYRDVFAWSYKDLKGVDRGICLHTIPMREDAKPSK